MSNTPKDDNFDNFMDASAEEWSKPEQPAPRPESDAEQADRWGSPIQEADVVSNANRWGSEPIEPTLPPKDKEKTKTGGSKWWIVAIIIAVLLCSCACVVLAGLEIFQVINIF